MCLHESIFCTNIPSALALNFRFGINSYTSLSALSALDSADWKYLSILATCLPLSSTSVYIKRDLFYLLAPPYPNILHPPIKIVLDPPVPIPPLPGLYQQHPSDRIGTFRLLHYPLYLGGDPTYLGVGRRESVPGRPRLVLLPLYILPQICNILADPSDNLGPGIALSLPYLFQHNLVLVDIPYKRFSPVPGVVPLPLVLPQPLHKIPPPPQKGI